MDTLPDTLTVMSGSGEGYHETFLNDGTVKNSNGSGDMSGAGEIRASNWLVVTPGSIHPSGGIYHTVNQRDLATLSNEPIPPKLVKKIDFFSKEDTEITEEDLESLSVEKNDIDIANQYLNDWKNEHMSAFYCLSDRLKGGRGDYGSELSEKEGSRIDRDLQEKTILTHLYGIYTTQGYSDSRSIELANNLLTHFCKQEPYTKDGKARKWAKRRVDYRTEQLRYAAIQFDKDEFRRFENKSTKATTRYKRRNNEYSNVTRGICVFAVEALSGVYDNYTPEQVHRHILPAYGFSLSIDEITALFNRFHMYNDMRGLSESSHQVIEDSYPKKSTVLDVCKQADGVYKGGRAKGTFGECLKRLKKEGTLKAAIFKQGTDNIRYYPSDCDDPIGAEYIRHNGEKYE